MICSNPDAPSPVQRYSSNVAASCLRPLEWVVEVRGDIEVAVTDRLDADVGLELPAVDSGGLVLEALLQERHYKAGLLGGLASDGLLLGSGSPVHNVQRQSCAYPCRTLRM